jgi:hypothetical protein
MSIKDTLNDALKDAMRANDAQRKMVLRGALAAFKQAEVDKGEQSEADLMGLLSKEVKSRRESIADAEKADRADLISEAEAEIVILEAFLPKGLSDEELKALVQDAVAKSGASSPADMGKVMGVLMPQIQGRADGGKVSQMVREALQG